MMCIMKCQLTLEKTYCNMTEVSFLVGWLKDPFLVFSLVFEAMIDELCFEFAFRAKVYHDSLVGKYFFEN